VPIVMSSNGAAVPTRRAFRAAGPSSRKLQGATAQSAGSLSRRRAVRWRRSALAL